MTTADQFVMAREDAKILQAAKELCSLYEERFSNAARNSLDSGSTVYGFAKAAQAFSTAESVLSSALIIAKIHGEQDALKDA